MHAYMHVKFYDDSLSNYIQLHVYSTDIVGPMLHKLQLATCYYAHS